MRARSHRRVVIATCMGLVLIYTGMWNLLFYPDYFAPIYFDWEARAGFRLISVAPPGKRLDPLIVVFDRVIALQARPWVVREFRKEGWESARGHLYVRVLPFPPVVLGLDQLAEPWEIIDPQVTPLMRAAELDDLQSVKRLLASGAYVNSRDQRGWTPLMHASKSSRATSQTVQMLIAAGADVNAQDRVGRTALIWASSGIDAADKVRDLLAAHADPNARSQFGETPLEAAVNVRSLDTAAELLAAHADPNATVLQGDTPLSIALGAGETKMADLLKRAGARR